jgi:hypothetical protein
MKGGGREGRSLELFGTRVGLHEFCKKRKGRVSELRRTGEIGCAVESARVLRRCLKRRNMLLGECRPHNKLEA